MGGERFEENEGRVDLGPKNEAKGRATVSVGRTRLWCSVLAAVGGMPMSLGEEWRFFRHCVEETGASEEEGDERGCVFILAVVHPSLPDTLASLAEKPPYGTSSRTRESQIPRCGIFSGLAVNFEEIPDWRSQIAWSGMTRSLYRGFFGGIAAKSKLSGGECPPRTWATVGVPPVKGERITHIAMRQIATVTGAVFRYHADDEESEDEL
jgi:hypothetical protein